MSQFDGQTSTPRGAGGFTLLELLAVLLLTSLVLGVALDFYLDLSRATARATESTRDLRQAVAILDRIGRDLEGATLQITPEGTDPNLNPWIFLAENRFAEKGSDQLKFVVRGNRSRRSDAAESDLLMVSYTVDEDENGGLELRRWSSPQLPDGVDREFPSREESDLVADGLGTLHFLFLKGNGDWTDTWDSSLVVDANELPIAVKIEVTMTLPEDIDADIDANADEPPSYRKVVMLPVPPLDLVAMTDPAVADADVPTGEGDGEGDPNDPNAPDNRGRDEDREVGASKEPSPFRGDKTVANCVNVAALPAAFNRDYLVNYVGQVADVPMSKILPGLFPEEAIRPECFR